uniref:Uncharacterized protein n=1 Tax=Phaeomonas parva TaxID=124430 RepID=A0A7S1UBS1_9STRA|mmetsp:Transcript_39249/g.122847  ORF Transcript_39249/g.122847 Transcript_39249/m.122847 type:complete len:283 (+) Transcript_39249:687-1535(+)
MLDAVFHLLVSPVRWTSPSKPKKHQRRHTSPQLSKYRSSKSSNMGQAQAQGAPDVNATSPAVAAGLPLANSRSTSLQSMSAWNAGESTPIRIPQRIRKSLVERQEHRRHNERRAARARVRSRSLSCDSTEEQSWDNSYSLPKGKAGMPLPPSGAGRKRRLSTRHRPPTATASMDDEDCPVTCEDNAVVLMDCANCATSFPVERRMPRCPTFCSGECAQSNLARQSFGLEPPSPIAYFVAPRGAVEVGRVNVANPSNDVYPYVHTKHSFSSASTLSRTDAGSN